MHGMTNVKNNNLIILTKYDRNKVLYILFLQLFLNMTEELKVQHATMVTATYMYPYTLAISYVTFKIVIFSL